MWAAQGIVVLKILLEDGPELLLEYYYVDRYVTANQPWWLVVKDVITGLIYIIPLVKIVKSVKKDYEAQRDEDGSTARFFYLPLVLARVLFSLAMVARVVGMILQYTSGTIATQCLHVTDIGTLVQTPFSIGCMNPADWTIIVLLCGVLYIMFYVVSIALYTCIGLGGRSYHFL